MGLITQGLVLLIPSILEFQLDIWSKNNNLELYGVYFGIYNLRNFVYFSTLLFFVFYYYNLFMVGIFLLLSSLFIYYRNIYRWRHVIKN